MCDDAKVYNEKIRPLYARMEPYRSVTQADLTEDEKAKIAVLTAEIRLKSLNVMRKYVEEHPDSYFVISTLRGLWLFFH